MDKISEIVQLLAPLIEGKRQFVKCLPITQDKHTAIGVQVLSAGLNAAIPADKTSGLDLREALEAFINATAHLGAAEDRQWILPARYAEQTDFMFEDPLQPAPRPVLVLENSGANLSDEPKSAG